MNRENLFIDEYCTTYRRSQYGDPFIVDGSIYDRQSLDNYSRHKQAF